MLKRFGIVGYLMVHHKRYMNIKLSDWDNVMLHGTTIMIKIEAAITVLKIIITGNFKLNFYCDSQIPEFVMAFTYIL